MKIAPIGTAALPLPNAAGEAKMVSEGPVAAGRPVLVAERTARYWRMNVAVGVLAISVIGGRSAL